MVFTVFLFALGLWSNPAWTQTSLKGFAELSAPEKWWVIGHPFKAKRAYRVSREALKVTDSLEDDGRLGKDRNGGDLDAFKHGYWMARLSTEIGQRAALKLGRAHEKGNYRDFKKGRKEDGGLPDGPSCEMDLFNNQRGADLAKRHPGAGRAALIGLLIEEVSTGGMKVLYKNEKAFLDCQGRPLDASEISGRWDNAKCLVPSGG